MSFKYVFMVVAMFAMVSTAFAGVATEQVEAINKAFATQNVSDAAKVGDKGEVVIVLIAKTYTTDSLLETVLATSLLVGKLPELESTVYVSVEIYDTAGEQLVDATVFPYNVKSMTGVELAQSVIDTTIIYD